MISIYRRLDNYIKLYEASNSEQIDSKEKEALKDGFLKEMLLFQNQRIIQSNKIMGLILVMILIVLLIMIGGLLLEFNPFIPLIVIIVCFITSMCYEIYYFNKFTTGIKRLYELYDNIK